MKMNWMWMGLAAMVLLVGACDDAATKGGLGSSCSSDDDCNEGFFCDPSSNTCQEIFGRSDVPSEDTTITRQDVPQVGFDTTPPDTGSGDVQDEDMGIGTCVDGQERVCGEGINECEVLVQFCVDGLWGECSAPRDQVEICDNKDNDCDGAVDEQLQEACGTETGICQTGVRTCNQGVWGPCKASIQPEEEVCDGLDNNCDGVEDEPEATDAQTWYRDSDGDDHGDPNDMIVQCDQPEGYVLDNTDCDDNDTAIHGDADEICDGKDNDCDTFADGLDPEGAQGTQTFYADTDEDTYGDPNNTIVACAAPSGYVANNQDCDDTIDVVNPGAREICDSLDNDCDGSTPDGFEENWYGDACDGADSDLCAEGNEACTGGARVCTDDDNEDDVEVCNGLDDDCDGTPDDGVLNTYYKDGDDDGFGDPNNTREACTAPATFVTDNTDCDDSLRDVNPDATEVCNGGIDDNCNGLADAADNLTPPVGNATWYEDSDGDQYGCNPAIDSNCATQVSCSKPAGFVFDNTDCNDGAGDVNPGEDEVCDGKDNDCKSSTPDGFDETWFLAACDGTDTDDCIEGNFQCSGGAQVCDDNTSDDVEICNGLDDDCDGTPDDGVLNTYYRDQDVDGYGNPARTVEGCTVPSGYVTDNTDCDDGDFDRKPVAGIELCDTKDNDCDASTPDGFNETWFENPCDGSDTDLCDEGVIQCVGGGQVCSDSSGNDIEVCDGVDNDCDPSTADGSVETWLGDACDGADSDSCKEGNFFCDSGVKQCDDTTSDDIEICNGSDDDCDNVIDENVTTTYYPDDDNDNFGDPNGAAEACSLPPGWTTNNTDCDDTLSNVNPDADEVCGNTIDENCDGTLDNGCTNCDPSADADFDGSNQCDDCDDTNGAIFPGASETCNGLDDDCDGDIDEDFDADFDGFSTCAVNPEDRDCNDNDANINPGALEACGQDDYVGAAACVNNATGQACDCTAPGTLNQCGNLVDENCNGYADEGCRPCNDSDTDGDGWSECDGDCDPSDPEAFPGGTETCDNKDNDCNVFTRTNCGVSDNCDLDGDGNETTGPDTCGEEFFCVSCAPGTCQGSVCVSFCGGSYTGEVGDGCTSTQSCYPYIITGSTNEAVCDEKAPGAIGTRASGDSCTSGSQCRSGTCDKPCKGPGCNTTMCLDHCSHHDPGAPGSCAAGSVCWVSGGSASCAPDFFGSQTQGQSCSGGCTWGSGSCVDNSYCAQPCRLQSHCPSGTHCSVHYTTSSNEVIPLCLEDSGPGNFDRPAGAACNQNGDCQSDFCEASTGICMAMCTGDSSCPNGLECYESYVELNNGLSTFSRLCLPIPDPDNTPSNPYQRM